MGEGVSFEKNTKIKFLYKYLYSLNRIFINFLIVRTSFKIQIKMIK
ncbi:hypothetical protein HMPREF3222_02717 [Clostridium perfringens]|uniref:Uncharacterized protein n=1 Tax=Clostridium perfringens TaxID=1502 RepID=A0A133MTI7_CLOPF|nr:hypothetical protein HMPREF3222_02717 [Clostridium perfringens]